MAMGRLFSILAHEGLDCTMLVRRDFIYAFVRLHTAGMYVKFLLSWSELIEGRFHSTAHPVYCSFVRG